MGAERSGWWPMLLVVLLVSLAISLAMVISGAKRYLDRKSVV